MLQYVVIDRTTVNGLGCYLLMTSMIRVQMKSWAFWLMGDSRNVTLGDIVITVLHDIFGDSSSIFTRTLYIVLHEPSIIGSTLVQMPNGFDKFQRRCRCDTSPPLFRIAAHARKHYVRNSKLIQNLKFNDTINLLKETVENMPWSIWPCSVVKPLPTDHDHLTWNVIISCL